MNLQNGYRVIYEKIADGERTFFADKLDGSEAKQLGDAIEIGKYKLVYEKNGCIYGSETGDVAYGICLEAFNEVFATVDAEETEKPAEQVNVTNEPEPTTVEDEGEDEEEPAEGDDDEIEE